MNIHGLHVIREDDNTYRILDAHGREPGAVTKHVADDGTKLFRAFGADFSVLSDAVFEFTKIPWVRVLDIGLDDMPKTLR